MANKFEIKQLIKDNIRLRKRDSNIDKLELLLPVGIGESSLKLDAPIVLKNSWRKKVYKYLLIAFINIIMIYWLVKEVNYGEKIIWFIAVCSLIMTVTYFVKFFERKTILEISDQGLSFGTHVLHKWDDIEYLHFKTTYDESQPEGTYLVTSLKNDFENEVLISDLKWSKDKLGTILYQCTRKYGKP